MYPVREKKDFLVFGQPHFSEEEINEVIDSLRSGWIGTGRKVQLFEEVFAAYKSVPFSAAVNSCTAALHLSLLAAGLQSGDEVITTPLTFCATVNAIIHSGATPVLADIDPRTFNIDPAEIEKRITPRTKALLVVHFAGRPCEMNRITALATKYQLKLIEDCAHAIEAEYHGQKIGTFGLFGCFSFYSTKNVATGEGGMIVTSHEAALETIKKMALHGMSSDAWRRFNDSGYRHYDVEALGFKYNMMDIQAALGIHQLRRVDDLWSRRKEIWDIYSAAFVDLPIALPPPVEENTRHAHHLFTILIDEDRTGIKRDDFLSAMTEEGIGVGVHYRSIPEHSYYRGTYGWLPQDYPHALRIGRQTVSIPLSGHLTDKDVDDVITAVRRIILRAK